MAYRWLLRSGCPSPLQDTLSSQAVAQDDCERQQPFFRELRGKRKGLIWSDQDSIKLQAPFERNLGFCH